MKSRDTILWILIVVGSIEGTWATEHKSGKLQAAALSDVRISDEFWAPRIETNHKVGIRHAFARCDDTGALSNFDKAAGVIEGEYRGNRANDSDVARTVLRGPLVYCLEEEDHESDVLNIAISKDMELVAKHTDELLGGLVVLRGHASATEQSPMEITAIPYYAWNNRPVCKMAVWLREKDTEDTKESRKPVKVFLLAGQYSLYSDIWHKFFLK